MNEKASTSGPSGQDMTSVYAKALAKRERRLATPEGVELKLTLGEAGERGTAMLIDLAIMLGILIALTLLCLGAFAAGDFDEDSGEAIAIVWILGGFLLRNFWFIGFEMGPRAATPGKRIMGLRVIARDGGRLTAQSIFARNAMREIEFFLPLSFAFSPAGTGWVSFAGLIWSLVFMLMPLFNKDKLRPGDIVGGTWVVKAPRVKLLSDLAAQGEAQLGKGIEFTREDMLVYGERELLVLDRILRSDNIEERREAARQIRRKLGRDKDKGFTDRDFLIAYYAALREHLEGRMVLGVRKKDKRDPVD